MFTQTSADGCEGLATQVDLVVNALPICTVSNSGITCAGEDLTLMETGGEATVWNWTGPGLFNSTTIQNPTVSPGVSGDYTVIITDGYGCTSSCTTSLKVPPPPSCGTFPANPPGN